MRERKQVDIEILKNLSNCYSTKKEAAAALNMSVDTLKKLLKESNINFDTSHWKLGQIQADKRKHPEVDEQWLINNWVTSTKSIKQLSQEFCISESLLESRITFYKLKKPYKHHFNTNKFFNLNDPHIWYLAGLLVTDGYFTKNYDSFTISLTGDSEYQLLKDIKTYYECSSEIKQYHLNSTKEWHFQIGSAGIQQFFKQNFNMITENKTFNAQVPQSFPSEDCAKAYVRGCIDGDGSIQKDGRCVTIATASEKFISGLVAIVKHYTGIEANQYYICRVREVEHLYPAAQWKTNKAKTLLTWIYSLEDCFRLERKYVRYSNNYI